MGDLYGNKIRKFVGKLHTLVFYGIYLKAFIFQKYFKAQGFNNTVYWYVMLNNILLKCKSSRLKPTHIQFSFHVLYTRKLFVSLNNNGFVFQVHNTMLSNITLKSVNRWFSLGLHQNALQTVNVNRRICKTKVTVMEYIHSRLCWCIIQYKYQTPGVRRHYWSTETILVPY